ncbi:MAG: glycosyltransferase [Phycisphaerae bacterium]
MTILCWILTGFAGLVTLVWLSRHLMIRRERRTGVVLTEDSPIDAAQLPPIDVIVAAKEEEDNIERCIRGLLAQDYPDFQLTVINDRSEDRTGEIIRSLAEGDDRIRVIEIEDLPDGWMGKNHAVHVASQQTSRPWMLMTDADCVFESSRAMAIAISHARRVEADLLSVLPRLVTRSFWEHVIQPVCGGVMMIWFHPDKVNNPVKPNAYANGAFILARREIYEQVGGHQAVRDEANEDMRLALNVKRQGHRLRVVRNQGLYSVRMYTGLRQIVNGWTRIFFGTFGTLRRLLISLLAMLLVSLSPWILLPTALAGWALAGGTCWAWASAVAGAALFTQMTVIWRFYGIVEVPRLLCVTYGLGSLMATGLLLRATAKLRKGAKLVWRGTSYATGAGRKSP